VSHQQPLKAMRPGHSASNQVTTFRSPPYPSDVPRTCNTVDDNRAKGADTDGSDKSATCLCAQRAVHSLDQGLRTATGFNAHATAFVESAPLMERSIGATRSAIINAMSVES
jgi:hypothetical protein